MNDNSLVDVDVDTPQPMTDEVRETMRTELLERRQQVEMAMRQYKESSYPKSQGDWKIRIARIDAALSWLDGLAKE